MAYFALSNNSNLASNVSKVKMKRHMECGTELTKTKSGKFFCPACLKTGYPVKAK